MVWMRWCWWVSVATRSLGQSVVSRWSGSHSRQSSVDSRTAHLTTHHTHAHTFTHITKKFQHGILHFSMVFISHFSSFFPFIRAGFPRLRLSPLSHSGTATSEPPKTTPNGHRRVRKFEVELAKTTPPHCQRVRHFPTARGENCCDKSKQQRLNLSRS